MRGGRWGGGLICNKVSAQHGTVIVIVALTMMPLIGKYANCPTNTKMWVITITEITKQGQNESLEFPFPAMVYCFCNQKRRTKVENM